MILLIFFSIFITLILNILWVKKIKNKTNRLVLYFSNIIFSIIFILLLLICNFSSVGLNYLVDKQIEKLEGITCGGKPTSCPDQLATALKEAIAEK